MESEQIWSLPEGLCRQFSIDDILAATHEFSDSLVIGQGGFAKVYKGVIDNASRTVAIKKLKSMSPELRKEFRDEILMVSKFRHSHLVSMLGYCETDDEMILVYEYVAGGTLYENLHKLSSNSVPLCWIERLKISIGVARGLDYLHTGTGINNKVIHRDIKSSNILLDQNLTTAKIADFGLSKIGPANQLDTRVSTRVMGTFGYMDPDYSSSGLLTSKSDVYAFGVVLFELLSGRPAVDSKLDYSQRGLAGWARVCVRKGRVEKIIDPSLKSEMKPRSLSKYVKIAERCLNERPKERPTMTEVLAELVLALSFQETGKQKGSTFSEKLLEFLSVKPWPISDNNALDHAIEAAPTDQKDKLLVAIDHELIAPILMDLDELEEISNVFSKNALIGEGSNASVYYGIFKCGISAAITKLDGQNFSKQAFIPRILYRQNFSNPAIITDFTVVRVKHENVVELLGYCVVHNRHFLVYEHASNGSLHNLLHGGPQPLPWATRIKVAIGAAKGLSFLHDAESQVIYRDFKASNILLDSEFNAKLSDFDLAKADPTRDKTHVTTQVMGTRGYAAPEYVATGRLTAKSDVYSFGVVLVELLSGCRAVDKSKMGIEQDLVEWAKPYLGDKRKLFRIMDTKLEGQYPKKAAYATAILALDCLNTYAKSRPRMSEVVAELEQIQAPKNVVRTLQSEGSKQHSQASC